MNNTVAVTHSAQDRVQLVQQYVAADPSAIINDLLVNFAGVPQSYITLANWQAEISTYLNTVYTAYIAEPTSVADLISELIEQVGLVLWWDDIAQQIRLQVLRPVASTADVYDATNYLAGSLNVTEQPEKRLTQVYTYFAKINPLIANDQINNYRSTSFIKDAAAEVSYGTPVIKKVYSRWIASGGRAVADTLGQLLLARFRDPPRRIAFGILRDSLTRRNWVLAIRSAVIRSRTSTAPRPRFPVRSRGSIRAPICSRWRSRKFRRTRLQSIRPTITSLFLMPISTM